MGKSLSVLVFTKHPVEKRIKQEAGIPIGMGNTFVLFLVANIKLNALEYLTINLPF